MVMIIFAKKAEDGFSFTNNATVQCEFQSTAHITPVSFTKQQERTRKKGLSLWLSFGYECQNFLVEYGCITANHYQLAIAF